MNPPFSRHLLLDVVQYLIIQVHERRTRQQLQQQPASNCKHGSNYCTVSMNFELHYYHALVGVVNQSGCGFVEHACVYKTLQF